jgi:hypothetical protein
LRKDAQNSMFVIEFEVCGRHNPPQGDKGPNRVATVLSKQTLAQQRLAKELGLDQLCSTQIR